MVSDVVTNVVKKISLSIGWINSCKYQFESIGIIEMRKVMIAKIPMGRIGVLAMAAAPACDVVSAACQARLAHPVGLLRLRAVTVVGAADIVRARTGRDRTWRCSRASIRSALAGMTGCGAERRRASNKLQNPSQKKRRGRSPTAES